MKNIMLQELDYHLGKLSSNLHYTMVNHHDLYHHCGVTTAKPSEGSFLCVYSPCACCSIAHKIMTGSHDFLSHSDEWDRKCHPVHIFVTVFLCFFTRVVRLITSTMVKMSSSLSGLCLWYVLHSPAAPSATWVQVLSLTDPPDQLNEVQCT